MSDNNEDKNQARNRIEKVFRFLQELHKLRTPPKQDLEDYDWKLAVHDLPKYPAIEIGEAPKRDDAATDDDTGNFLLRVTRQQETQCPEFDSSVPQFTLSASEHDTELYVSLLRYSQVDGKGIQRCKEKIASEQPHPFDGEKLNGILQYMVQTLFEDGRFFQSESESRGCTTPHIVRQPTFFLGLRNQGFVDAIDAFIDNLKSMTSLPEALVRVVGVEISDGTVDITEAVSSTQNANGSLEETSKTDYLLTKPANKEQERIIDRLEEAGTVLVQGPPGTGKSHTIANLIGHLLAQKKTILITSHAAKALKVVREKVVEPLQPLCVSVLDNDEESKRQLEESITGIVNYLSRTDAKKLQSEIKDLNDRREFLKNRVNELTEQLLIARGYEYADITVAGEAIAPSRAARILAEEKGSHDWIPAPVEHGFPLPLSAAELSELYATNNEMTKEEENTLARSLPELGRLCEPNELFDYVGEKKRLLSEVDRYNSDVWTHQNHNIQDLEEATVSLQKSLGIFEQSAMWVLECLDAGRLGGSHRERWLSLRNQIADASKEIASHHNIVLECGPTIDFENKNFRDLHKISIEIVEHLKAGGNLGFISTVFKSEWKEFIRVSRVNELPPTTTMQFKALNSLLCVMVMRDDLSKRWHRQMTSLGAPSIEGLGNEPPTQTLANYMVGMPEETHWINQFYLGSVLGWRRVEPQVKNSLVSDDYVIPVRMDRVDDENNWIYILGIAGNSTPVASIGVADQSAYFPDCSVCLMRGEHVVDLHFEKTEARRLFELARKQWKLDEDRLFSGAELSGQVSDVRSGIAKVRSEQEFENWLGSL